MGFAGLPLGTLLGIFGAAAGAGDGVLHFEAAPARGAGAVFAHLGPACCATSKPRSCSPSYAACCRSCSSSPCSG